MPSYDASHFNPPAPVARVTSRHPQHSTTVSDALLLMDTGADITLLPRTVVEQLGAPLLPDQQYELMGFDGSTSAAPVVILDMVFLRRTFHGRYLLVEAERGILGRDILNHVNLLLEGPPWPGWCSRCGPTSMRASPGHHDVLDAGT
jgi:predicted aspartyl protease